MRYSAILLRSATCDCPRLIRNIYQVAAWPRYDTELIFMRACLKRPAVPRLYADSVARRLSLDKLNITRSRIQSLFHGFYRGY